MTCSLDLADGEMTERISEPYRLLQRALHAAEDDYGCGSVEKAPLVRRVVQATGPASVLDYGAGKRRLIQAIPDLPEYRAYDPAFPEIAGDPDPADLVVCIDVLEHIEPECLSGVLDHLAALTMHTLLATVGTCPARRFLDDGRNAHLIQEPAEWWLPQVWARMEVTAFNLIGEGFWFTARHRAKAPGRRPTGTG